MFHIRQTFLFVTLSFTLILTAPLSATKLPDICDQAPTLRAGDTERQAGGYVAESHCYRLDLDLPGLLHLDVAVAPGSSSARLDLLESDASPSPRTLKRSAAEHLALADAGTYFVVVAAEDPRRPLPHYRLGSRFLELGRSETDGEIEVEPEGNRVSCGFKSETDGEIEVEPEGNRVSCGFKSETDGEIEVEPEGSRFSCGFKSETDGEIEVEPEGNRVSCGFKSETDGEIEVEPEGNRVSCGFKSETDGEIEVEPEGSRIACGFKSETDGEIEVEPEGSRAGGAPLLIARLCRSGEGDDHGDSLTCATPFAGLGKGELHNGWGDDVDVFRFELRDWQTVEIATAGGTDTHGLLLDQTGQRLAADDDGGEGDNFRLVRTLGPGTYFVRVGSADSGGLYTLAMRGVGR